MNITDSYPRLYWYISVISVYHICVDISQQYLFLDSDHSSTPGSRGDQADCPDPNIIAEEALLTQQSHLQDTQASRANSSSPQNSSFLQLFTTDIKFPGKVR